MLSRHLLAHIWDGSESTDVVFVRYLFLVERVHVLRAPYRSRWSDYLWLFSTIGICISLGAIGVAGFVVPITSLSEDDGRCRIGLQPYAIIPLLLCDIAINVLLTLVFIYLLSPVVRGSRPSGAGFASRLTRTTGNLCGRAKQRTAVNLHPANQRLVRRVERLLFKTLVGCFFVVLPASGNLIALWIYRGKMPAFVSQAGVDKVGIVLRCALLDVLYNLHIRWCDYYCYYKHDCHDMRNGIC